MFYGIGYYDPTFILTLLCLAFSLLASFMVNHNFKKYAKYRNYSGITGREAAERILRSQGINDVRVERVSGHLSDHYDPRNKVLRLSDSTYDSASIAAVGVAAHECGHAVQHATGYFPIRVRGALVPVANLGSNLGYILVIIGLFFNSKTASGIIMAGLILFSAAVLFQIVTLPVEFNASIRAVKLLDTLGIQSRDELRGTKKVLTAAALTYVAGAATAIVQLLRLILIANSRDRD